MENKEARREALLRVRMNRRKRAGLQALPGRKGAGSMMDDQRLPRDYRKKTGEEIRDRLKKQRPMGRLTGGQIKIAAKAPPRNKITGADFAVLQKEKAKGRGKGLQDEKMKPGKVMKANKGLLAGIGSLPGKQKKGLTPEKARKAKEELLMDRFRKFREKQRNKPKTPLGGKMKNPKPGSSDYQILQTGKPRPSQILPKKKMGGVMKANEGGMGEAKGYKKYLKGLKKAEGAQFRAKFKAKEIAKAGGKAALKAARATTIGKIALGVAAVGLGAKEFLKRKMEKRKRIKREKDAVRGLEEDMAVEKLQEQVKKGNKKMGGGMMMRPNPVGYKTGRSVNVKCKLGRNKPTKMY